jgi:hypothetical protein
MAEQSMFFDSVDGDRQYYSSDIAAIFRGLHPKDGIVLNMGDLFAKTNGFGMEIVIGTGAAWVQGRLYTITDAAKVIAIPAADATLDRIDRVVIRLDLNIDARNITTLIKQGIPGTTPVPPSLQRDQYTWELSLYQYLIPAAANQIDQLIFTDERPDDILCGWINSIYYETFASQTVSGLMSKEDKTTLDKIKNNATPSTDGLMSSLDKTKLDGISETINTDSIINSLIFGG